MKPPQQRRDHMRVLGVEVVARAIQVGGHHAAVITPMLAVVAFTQLDAGDLGNGVGLVRGFQRAGEQRVFTHRLRRHARVDARRTQKQQPLHPGRMRGLDDIGLDHQVVVQKISRIGVVGVDAAHLGRGQHHLADLVAGKERPHVGLAGQIKLAAAGGDDVAAALRLQPPHDGRAHHATVAGHKHGVLVVGHALPSRETTTSCPCAFKKAVRRADFRSSATISAHICCAVISGTQPSLCLALDGSPSRVSTSAGRK